MLFPRWQKPLTQKMKIEPPGFWGVWECTLIQTFQFGGGKIKLQEREVIRVEELWILTIQILIFHRIHYYASKNGNR